MTQSSDGPRHNDARLRIELARRRVAATVRTSWLRGVEATDDEIRRTANLVQMSIAAHGRAHMREELARLRLPLAAVFAGPAKALSVERWDEFESMRGTRAPTKPPRS